MTKMLVGSTTWLITPCAVKSRCNQNPSRPASKQLMPYKRETRHPEDPAGRRKPAMKEAGLRWSPPLPDDGSQALSFRGTRYAMTQEEELSSIAR